MISPTNENSSAQAEAAENLALETALKKVRLIEAAKAPTSSWIGWGFAGVGIVAVILLRGEIVNYLWLVIIWVAISIRSHFAAVHRRIDAIQELRANEIAEIRRLIDDVGKSEEIF
ncbi:MAG: hypothetical protein QM680_12975 [Luteolibacter sp.]